MKLATYISTLLLASGALAKCRRDQGSDCDDTSALSDYAALEYREVGARNTLVSHVPGNHFHGVRLFSDRAVGLEALASARWGADLVLA